MITAVLSPLRKQGDVSKDLIAPTAVLPQGSSAPPTATTSHEQGRNTSPTATSACTQGSGSSLLDTLACCYAPHCTPGPSPYIYKRKVQGPRTRRWSRGRMGRRTRLSLSLPPSRTLVTPYCKRIRPGRRTTRGRGFPLLFCPLVFRLAPTHLGWDTQRQFTRRSRDPPGSKRRQKGYNRLKQTTINLQINFTLFTLCISLRSSSSHSFSPSCSFSTSIFNSLRLYIV
jgi:hypothetical protein